MEVLSQVRLFIPDKKDIPTELVAKWQEGYYQAVRKTSGHRRKAVGTIKAYQEKVAQPLTKGFALMIDPKFVSRSGKMTKEIIREQQKQLTPEAARKYLTKLGQAFSTVDGIKAKKIKDRLVAAGKSYAHGMAYRLWPLLGGVVAEAKGPVILAQLWLTGDETVSRFLRKEDAVLKGGPVLITNLTRRGRFKQQLNNRLIQAGVEVIETGWLPSCLQEENEATNHLVQRFARSEFASFTPSGASHLDFLIKEIPDPKDLKKTIKQLYLEIQVARA